MKVSIPMWVVRQDYSWSKEPIYSAYPFAPSGKSEEMVLVGETVLEFDVPDDFNPVPAKIAALNEQLDTLANEYHGKVAQIKGRINDLLCLEAPEVKS